jgi:glycolate oxidase iron-sulfur subunit
VVCPVFKVDSREALTARGKMHLVNSRLASQVSTRFEDLFSECLLCGACEQVCPRNLPITDIISRARSHFSLFYGKNGLQKMVVRSVLARSGLLKRLVRAGVSLKQLNALPETSGLRLKLGLLETNCSKQHTYSSPSAHKSDVSYFTGCLARFIQPSVAEATEILLKKIGLSSATPHNQGCCGLAAWSAGKRDEARELAQKNIVAFEETSGDIITSCSSCSSHLFTYPKLFAGDKIWQDRAEKFAGRVQEFTRYFSVTRPLTSCGGKLEKKQVFYHDPCHLRFKPQGCKTPRNLLRLAGFTLLEPETGASCCGQGGLFHLAYPQTAEQIFRQTAETVLSLHPEVITTTCSGCLMQYQQGLKSLDDETEVVHLAVLLAGKNE